MSPLSLDELVDALSADEPNYPELAKRYGSDALPWLSRLAADNDTIVASRAVALAGLIEGPDRFAIVEAASKRPEERIRIAVAGAAPQLTLDEAATVVTSLLADSGEDVRNAALKAVEAWPNNKLRDRLRTNILALSEKDPEPWLRARAVDVATLKHHGLRWQKWVFTIVVLVVLIIVGAYLLLRLRPTPDVVLDPVVDPATEKGKSDGEPKLDPNKPIPRPPLPPLNP